MNTVEKQAHTPWHVEACSPDDYKFFVNNECGDTVATTTSSLDCARLISAAPAMLEALESCLLKLECFDPAAHRAGTCLDRRVRAVIRLAKGEGA